MNTFHWCCGDNVSFYGPLALFYLIFSELEIFNFFILIKYSLSTGSCQSLIPTLRFPFLNSLFCPGMHFYSSPYINFTLMWASSIWEQLHQTFVWVCVFCSLFCGPHFTLFQQTEWCWQEGDWQIELQTWRWSHMLCIKGSFLQFKKRKCNIKLHELLK